MTTVDESLLNRHRAPPEQLDVVPGCFTNWLGLKTDATLFARAPDIQDKVFAELPTGGDGVYGGYAEYASLLTAIERTPNRQSYTAIELGAGWGPWISAIGKVCQRLGFAEINLTGVEADEVKCRLMREHLARNGLSAEIVRGAAWSEDTTLKFPVIHPQDYGAAASTLVDSTGRDYRGLPQQYTDVPAFSLRTICRGTKIIDYMHWDIQGAESTLARSDPDLLNERVRFLFIGTHSRPIEGGLVEFFFEHGWEILHQHPCHFAYDRHKPSIEGMTLSDGELFASNPRIA